MLSILLGLTSAITWGAGDFTGGLAARKTGAYRAVFYGEAFGLVLLFAVVLASPQPMPDVKSILLSIAAGALGTVGLMLLYSAMAQGKMSIAAPVSALLAAALPVIVGMITDGFPGYLTLLGLDSRSPRSGWSRKARMASKISSRIFRTCGCLCLRESALAYTLF